MQLFAFIGVSRQQIVIMQVKENQRRLKSWYHSIIPCLFQNKPVLYRNKPVNDQNKPVSKQNTSVLVQNRCVSEQNKPVSIVNKLVLIRNRFVSVVNRLVLMANTLFRKNQDCKPLLMSGLLHRNVCPPRDIARKKDEKANVKLYRFLFFYVQYC